MELTVGDDGEQDGANLSSHQTAIDYTDGHQTLPPLRFADPSVLRTTSIGRTIGEGDFSLLTNLTWLTGEAHVNATMGPGEADSRVLPSVICAAIGLGLGWTRTLRGFLIERFSFCPLESKELS